MRSLAAELQGWWISQRQWPPFSAGCGGDDSLRRLEADLEGAPHPYPPLASGVHFSEFPFTNVHKAEQINETHR